MVVKKTKNVNTDVEEIDFDEFIADIGFISIKKDTKIELRFEKIPKLKVSTNRFNKRQFEFPVIDLKNNVKGTLTITHQLFLKKLIELRIPQDGLSCKILRTGEKTDTVYKVAVIDG